MSQRTQADLTQRFDTCKRAALGEIDRILAQWLPGGQTQKREYVVKNPTRDDSHAGSFSVNLDHGGWYDFATGDKGGDLVALVAYVEHCEQYAALQRMESFLGIDRNQDGLPLALVTDEALAVTERRGLFPGLQGFLRVEV